MLGTSLDVVRAMDRMPPMMTSPTAPAMTTPSSHALSWK